MHDAGSPLIENIIYFHDIIMMYSVVISITLLYIILFFVSNGGFLDKRFVDNQVVEIVWLLSPSLLLLILSVPSLQLLYIRDDFRDSLFSVKVIGHQWYWRYEYRDFNNKSFDSYMVDKNRREDKELFRLLDVDNYIVLPVNSQVRLLISSTDVIHSFSLPSICVKVDAVPGRINQVTMMPYLYGVYYGQCSELCGVNHRFIPIGLEVVSWKYFINWLKKE